MSDFQLFSDRLRLAAERMSAVLVAGGIADLITIDGVGHQPSRAESSTIDISVDEESSDGSPFSGRAVTVSTTLTIAVTGGKTPKRRMKWIRGMARELLWSDSWLQVNHFVHHESTTDRMVLSEPPGQRVVAFQTAIRTGHMDDTVGGSVIGIVDNVDAEIQDSAAGDGAARAHVILVDVQRRIRWVSLFVVIGPLVQTYMFTGATLGDVIEVRDEADALIESTTALTAPTGEQTTTTVLGKGRYSITMAGVSSPSLLTITEAPS